MKRYEIDGLVERPAWWKVRPDEINAQAEAVQKGSARRIATTPGGLPVWSVAYGGEAPQPGTSNWPSGSSSRNVASYRTGEADPQTVMLLCGIHGAGMSGKILIL